MKCILCNEVIDVQPGGWAEGHNAEPVAPGRCCTACNLNRVIPTRIAIYRMRIEQHEGGKK